MTTNEIEMFMGKLDTILRKCDRALYLMDVLEKEINRLKTTSNSQYNLKCANVKLDRLRNLKTKWDKDWLSLVESAYKTLT